MTRFFEEITMGQAQCVLLVMVLGLECFNAHGIIHSDVRPRSSLWTKDYRVTRSVAFHIITAV